MEKKVSCYVIDGTQRVREENSVEIFVENRKSIRTFVEDEDDD